eukprot:CAMPEP_0183324602 /NCGR_PEP_ID=MMETSP0160_2-20130417/77475_1 /TAXON_ID=2839 ORGANISM="Odontella Sinensis, Strain Grunow 1884" /NCGR_SAMPLE_ID=MMETSP0160_2 /ASSEMBLY_ACC=CAM_ASM_000250 /LENGTH=328 /DNA_ID=CAMNT_0025492215 /DNA_START=30 /DNA_END=1013 /DNA_ORIENTATION=-
MPTAEVSAVRSANWCGCIPVVVNLAPTSLSSPTMPPPLHRMVSRMSYLHLGLADEVKRLYKFAPATLSFGFKRGGESGSLLTGSAPRDENISKGDGEHSAGESDDSNRTTSPNIIADTAKYPVCWFEDESSGMALRWHMFAGVLYDIMKDRKKSSEALPWRLRVHFTSYPTHQILSFANGNVPQTLEHMFNNSLKQALFLQHGSSKVAMGLSKASHQKLWDAIVGSHYALYEEINGDGLQSCGSKHNGGENIQYVPVRVMVDNKPALQRPCTVFVEETNSVKRTIGDLLADWLPDKLGGETSLVNNKDVSVSVQGISLSLSIPILDVW